MLLIEHKADFLYREDAYEDYSWYLDHGAQRPGANLYLCFENFRNLCLDNDLQLLDLSSQCFQARNEREKINVPYQFSGLVKRILNIADAREVQKYLYEGKNVLALFPLAFYIHAHYSHEVEKLEKTLQEPFQAFSLLNVDMRKQINLR